MRLALVRPGRCQLAASVFCCTNRTRAPFWVMLNLNLREHIAKLALDIALLVA